MALIENRRVYSQHEAVTHTRQWWHAAKHSTRKYAVIHFTCI